MNDITTPIKSLSDLAMKLGGDDAAQLYKAIDFITAQSAENIALRGLINDVGCVLDSNLPMDRKKLADTIEDGLVKVDRVSTELTLGEMK